MHAYEDHVITERGVVLLNLVVVVVPGKQITNTAK